MSLKTPKFNPDNAYECLEAVKKSCKSGNRARFKGQDFQIFSDTLYYYKQGKHQLTLGYNLLEELWYNKPTLRLDQLRQPSLAAKFRTLKINFLK